MSIDTAIREAVAQAVAPLAAELRELRQKIDPPKEWVTVHEAADQFGVSVGTVRRWISEGRIEAKGKGKAKRVRV